MSRPGIGALIGSALLLGGSACIAAQRPGEQVSPIYGC